MGTNPSGTFGTVKDRLNYLDDLLNTIVAYIMSLSAYQISIADLDGYFVATTVEDALRELSIGIQSIDLAALSVIGVAEDGAYTDGLFEDFVPSTPVGTAVDRFNEVLKELAPAPAPDLADITFSTAAGTEGRLSFGTSNAIATYTNVTNVSGESALDVNGLFANNSAARRGIYASSFGSKTGILAGGVSAGSGSPTPSYPAQAFGNADQGELEIHVNGALIHSVDLSSFGSGATNTGGTGFVLSAATDTSFPNGNPFSTFAYRTGTWVVSTTHEVNGHNYVEVRHVVGVTTYTTNMFEWVIDDSVTATTYASETLGSLSMTGSKHISGVEYHTGGTASYSVTVQNPYRNTFNSSASAVYHTASTNCTLSASSIPNIAGAPYQASTIAVAKTATISASLLLDEQIVARTSTLRTAQGTVTSTGSAISFLLMNAVADAATATSELMDGEAYRVPSNRSLTDTSGFTSGGAALWDSTISIVSGTAGYSDGLLVYNRALYYPNNAAVAGPNGNFSAIANGPAGNPDYSAASGTRTYLRYFYFSTPAQNFALNISHTGANFKTVASGLTSMTGDSHIEILAPNTTTDGVSAEFKDALVSYTSDDDIGCHAATYGSTAYTSWGITLGSKSTSTSGNSVIVKITVPLGWSGVIADMSLTAV
jgi:hypothetical protein